MTNTSPVLIYSSNPSVRLQYCLDFCFKEKGQSYLLINNQSKFSTAKGVKINYSDEFFENTINIKPSAILFETAINLDHDLNYNKKFNKWEINKLDDPFAIVFYFLTRYEEYIVLERDNIGRFEAINSLAFKFKQLDIPTIDQLVKTLWNTLDLDYLSVQSKFNILPSFDIDVAWAYKNKGIKRTVLGTMQSIKQGVLPTERTKVLRDKKQDPFDSYELIQNTVDRHGGILFFLLGDWHKNDKNNHWKNAAYQNLIRTFSKTTKVGIHPSFDSYLNVEKVKKEVKRLNKITGEKTLLSRQHFLMLSIPESYQILINLGITADYSMGYADHYGFRAGTSFPFYYFDLSSNSQTQLKLYPISYMDGTLKTYLSKTPEEAIEIIHKLKKSVELVGGTFVPLWHNHSIADTEEWQGWNKVFLANF